MTVTFKVNSLKSSLQQKTTARRKKLEGKTSVQAIAASTDFDLLPDIKFVRRQIKSLKAGKRRVRKTAPEQLQRVMLLISAES